MFAEDDAKLRGGAEASARIAPQNVAAEKQMI